MAENIVLNGVEYAPVEKLVAETERANAHRRTLTLVHMHLTYREEDQALERLVRDTGYTPQDAHVARQIVEWATGTPAAPGGTTDS